MALADRMLAQIARLLGDVCQCPSVAVWACMYGKIELRYGNEMVQGSINVGHRAWLEHRRQLEDAQVVVIDGYSLAPIMSSQHDLVGVLALQAPLPRDSAAAQYFARELARLATYVQRPLPPPDNELLAVPIDSVEQPGGPEELTRLGYEALMVRHGWNVKLVASLMGIPRPTLAARLRKLSVKRSQPSTKARTGRGKTIDLADAAREILWPRLDRTLPARR